ncbi:uncharacterized protein [Argopecten irradians]|uniref:uncharacterized protein n=1 Tax=Argopecten irradians TaxID=31199 RepID=UPI00371CF48B
MKQLLSSVLVALVYLHFRCKAEVVMVEDATIQRLIRKYMPTYLGQKDLVFGEPSGNATSCGPEQANIVITWSPKTIILGQAVSINGTMIAPVDLDVWTATATVYIAGESTPFAGITFKGGCDTLKQQGFVGLHCPIKKNDRLKVSYISPESSTARLIEGHFILKVEVKNGKDEEFGCVKVDAVIRS